MPRKKRIRDMRRIGKTHLVYHQEGVEKSTTTMPYKDGKVLRLPK